MFNQIAEIKIIDSKHLKNNLIQFLDKCLQIKFLRKYKPIKHGPSITSNTAPKPTTISPCYPT